MTLLYLQKPSSDDVNRESRYDNLSCDLSQNILNPVELVGNGKEMFRNKLNQRKGRQFEMRHHPDPVLILAAYMNSELVLSGRDRSILPIPRLYLNLWGLWLEVHLVLPIISKRM